MTKRVVLGFVYAALTPMALASVAAIALVGGSIFAVPIVVPIALIASAPLAIGFTIFFGVPIYYVFRRLHILSLRAYLLAGLVLALPVAGYLLWSEYAAGYLNANQALLNHLAQIVCLISGPAATAVFHQTVRPLEIAPKKNERGSDLIAASTSPRTWHSRTIPVAVGSVLLLVWFVLSVTFSLHTTEGGRAPLMTEKFPFDSTRAAALVVSLDAYARANRAHLSYGFMPVSFRPGGFHLMAELDFQSAIEIIVTTGAGREELSAYIYLGNAEGAPGIEPIWSEFIAFLENAVDRANSLAGDELPLILTTGEGGMIPPSPWWDWRFQRDTLRRLSE